LLVALTTALLNLVKVFVNPAVVALLYLLPVGASTALWGLGPGVLAAFTAFLAFNYFFIPPYFTLLVHQTQDFLGLVVFLGVAVVINQLLGRTRHSLAEATAREREATRLYELSQSLSGHQDVQTIALAIAQKTLESFQANWVEVVLEASEGRQGTYIQLPKGKAAVESKPSLVVPLQAARGLLGEIRLGRAQPPLSGSERRMLQTFASQGTLALERAWLTQAETRAKVLEESDRLKSSLLSSVSHELRTPLATIKAAVTGLSSQAVDWDSEARAELLLVIDEETDHLDRLVGNLLNMSRIEAGALKPARKWHPLEEIVSGVVYRIHQRDAARLADQQHILQIDIPDDLPLVPVDYIQMEQVFTNLLSNSLKYPPPGTTVKISARQTDDKTVWVQVCNQGPRVPEEHLERIFDKFYRVTAADRVTGAGLGLSICKGIVEAHGGRIWAENLPDGLAFNFTIPSVWEGATARMDS
jgi:two-component system sensor histidine kinase KdpD